MISLFVKTDHKEETFNCHDFDLVEGFLVLYERIDHVDGCEIPQRTRFITTRDIVAIKVSRQDSSEALV